MASALFGAFVRSGRRASVWTHSCGLAVGGSAHRGFGFGAHSSGDLCVLVLVRALGRVGVSASLGGSPAALAVGGVGEVIARTSVPVIRVRPPGGAVPCISGSGFGATASMLP
jgi:hypothetical protein